LVAREHVRMQRVFCTCRGVSPVLCMWIRERAGLGHRAHRIVTALAHDGLHVAEGTLAGVFAACSDLLVPLAAAYRGAIDSIDFVPRHACCGRSRRRALPQGV
jgi:hypothetical protein